MLRSILRRLVLIAIAGVLAAAPDAAAQEAAGPYAGLFGGGGANRVPGLDLRGSLFGAVDDVLPVGDVPADAPWFDRRFLRSGFASGANAGLFYAKESERLRLESSAAAAYRLYAADDDASAATFDGRTAFATNLSSRVTIGGMASWAYSPYYEFAPGLDVGLDGGGGGGIGTSFGLATAAARSRSTAANASLEGRLSRRSTIAFEVSGNHSDFIDVPDSTVTLWGARGTFSHALTRTLGVHAGYGRERADYGLADVRDVVSDTIDLGVDYGDTLAFSRRTALVFSVSTGAIRHFDKTWYRVNGAAVLRRLLGRSASMAIRYARDTEFAAGLRAPLLSDAIGIGLSRQFGIRTLWASGAAYLRGTIGFHEPYRVETYSGGTRLTVALSRRVGTYVQYLYYRSELPAGATTFAHLPLFSRQSVTTGLTLWAPIIDGPRSPGDTR